MTHLYWKVDDQRIYLEYQEEKKAYLLSSLVLELTMQTSSDLVLFRLNGEKRLFSENRP